MRTTPLFCLAALSLGASASALDFNFTYNSSISAQALAGFQQAGAIWSSRLKDNITVNINIGYSSLGSGIIGQTGSTSTTYGYSSFRSALSADRTTALDNGAVNGLASGTTYSFATNGTTNNNYGVHTATSNLIRLSSANAKAVGLYAGSSAASDASITFNSNFAFDFDRSNGIDSNKFDFVGVAAHEIGHALGFTSGVDSLDTLSYSSSTSDATLNSSHTALDLFRYANVNGTTQRAFLVGNAFSGDGSVQFDSYFSTTGAGSGPRFSTGVYEGDGNQASHWKDNDLTGNYIGIMDPTGDYGQLLYTNETDFAAFDAIGYNVVAPVPEPTSLAALGLGVAAVLRRRRRQA